MKLHLRSIFLVAFALFSESANAYEITTHGAMTQAAFGKSVLNDAAFRADLGIPDGQNPFGEAYYDVSGGVIRQRSVSDTFEGKIIKRDLGADPLSLVGWLMRGAIREDDLGQILGVNVGNDPHDDPYGNIFRVVNHFYDPALDRPLTVGVALGQKAPDWAIGSANTFTQPNTPETGRRNHFTVFDAREAMYRALTGRDSQNNVVASTETDRNKYWATTFRALGDTIHLLQDMGQPQHTRNDQHAGKTPTLVTGEESVFEQYIDARATVTDSYAIDGTKVTPPQLTYTGYTPPTFTKYSDFWSTRTGTTGLGLADYSNRGFFTAGTNLGSNSYTLPTNNAASYTPESASGLLPNQPLQKINFLKGNVNDYNPSASTVNIRMTTESIWDSFLTTKTYSLNRFNYDAMADLLIPRSVAYSAGLINYFFRGKIDFVAVPNSPGAYTIKNLSAEAMTGKFVLYYDDVNGARQPVPGATWSLTIAANSQYSFVSFTPPVSPAPKVTGEYTLVFNGDMGAEKATPGVTVGAVAAKHVLAYAGVLYLAGQTSTGQYVYLRTDQSGTSEIASGLNPFIFNQYNVGNGTYVSRLDVLKQVRFSGYTGYEVTAVSVRSADGGFPEYKSYVRDTGTKVWAPALGYGGVAWKAASTDPTIGEFSFVASSNDLDNSQLRYYRTYINGSGIQASDSGVLQLPPLPAGAVGWVDGYKNFLNSKLVVSPDGKNVFGLLAFDGNTGYFAYRLDLMLGAVPSAILTPTDTWLTMDDRTLSPATYTVVGHFTATAPGDYCPGSTYTGDITHTLEEDTHRITLQRRYPIGYFSGLLATYWAMDNDLMQDKVDMTGGGISMSAGCTQSWVYSTRSGYVLHSVDALNSFNFQDGIIPSPWRSCSLSDSCSIAGICSPTDSYTIISYFYEGYWPAPVLVLKPFAPAYNHQVTILRTLGPSYQNVVKWTYGQGQQFRGIQVDQGYVADVSPIGEVFLATPDLSVVIHEPRLGGMKKVVIPPQVTKLIAAIWL